MLAARFGIRSIPVPVFYDRYSSEAFRHEGLFPEMEINKILAKIGVN